MYYYHFLLIGEEIEALQHQFLQFTFLFLKRVFFICLWLMPGLGLMMVPLTGVCISSMTLRCKNNLKINK